MCITKIITFTKKNIVLYKGGKSYFIVDQYKKDNNFDCKDTIFECKDTIFDCKDVIFDCEDTNFDCKDTIFDYEDAYHHYDIDVDIILLIKSGSKYLIRYKHSNKIVVVPLQLKIKIFTMKYKIIITVMIRYTLKIVMMDFFKQ